MPVFEEIHVLPKYPATVYVQWEMDNHALPENYYFYLYWSSSTDSDFKAVNTTPVINSYHFEFPFTLLTKEEYLFIKIKAVIGSLVVWSNTQGLFYNLDRRQYLIVKEIIRKHDLLRRKKVGAGECLVYKRKVFGAPCLDCIDPHTGRLIDSRCTSCFGTGKLGGYHDPISTWVEIVEADRHIKPSEMGTLENRFSTGNLTLPIVQKGDIIVEAKRNKRWNVEGIKRSALQTVPIDQTVELRGIPTKDIIYSLSS